MASTSSCVSVDANNSLLSSQRNSRNTNEHESIKSIFYKKLVEYDDYHTGSSKKPWTRERIEEVIQDLKNIKSTVKKKPVDYYWINKYEVLNTAGEEYLIVKKKHYSDPTVRIMPREEYFDLLSEIHVACQHGGRNKMLEDIKSSKFYIPKKAVEIFIQICPVCNSKRNHNRNENVRATPTGNFCRGGQFELVDFQSCADGDFNWLLVYQNIVTKFIIIRPLKSPGTAEVATELMKIFLTFGSPNTLKSDLGANFTEDVLTQLSVLWSDCKITLDLETSFYHNSPEVKTWLKKWMSENHSSRWSIGCYFMQYHKNVLFDQALGKMPYEAFFGCSTKVGVNSSYTGKSSNAVDEMIISEGPVNEKGSEVEVRDIKIEIDDSHTDLLNRQPAFEEKNTRHFSHIESTDEYKCKSCNSLVHTIHEVINDDKGHRLKISCYECKNEQVMELQRIQGTKRSAEDLITEDPQKIPALGIGQTVLVSIPRESREQFNTKFITAKIVDFRYGVYRVATKIGTIKNWFPRHELQYVEASYGEVLDTPINLEEVIANQVASSVQETTCKCRPAVNQCHTNKCTCFKNKKICGPECHQSLICINT